MTPTKAQLLDMIIALQERLDRLEGKPAGEITWTEARLANERGDMATVKKFNEEMARRYMPDSGRIQIDE